MSAQEDQQGLHNARDTAREPVFEARAADWRVGPVVYQVMVDRFCPPVSLEAKKALYPAPKTLHDWSESPRRGRFLASEGVWSHELAFWGGDLGGVLSKLDHIEGLGVDVLYTNPLQKAHTNHKYDPIDFNTLSPDIAAESDLDALIAALDKRGMKLVLDGVFNHMGRRSEAFQEARSSPASPWRSWFDFDDSLPFGVRCWRGAPNLVELCLERPEVAEALYRGRDSLVQSMLRRGVSGWRLDVAHDLGFRLLGDLRASAREAREDAWIVGEAWNYPESWVEDGVLDGVMNMHLRQLIMGMLRGPLRGGQAGRLIERMINDAGLEGMLRSWLVLDNHDLPRLATALPRREDRALAQILQMTLPGAPVLYYGVEVGMEGGEDPAMRGPMRWDRVEEGHPESERLRKLLSIRRQNPSLRIGDFRLLDTEHLLAYQRRTVRASESVVVILNPEDRAVEELVALRDSKLMDAGHLQDLWGGGTHAISAGTIWVTVPAKGALILRPETAPQDGYTAYKRVL